MGPAGQGWNAFGADMTDGLRLRAKSDDDLQVLSALLQDAIIPGEDMVFERAGNRFIMVANRFCWDQPPEKDLKSADGGSVYQRRLCGVQFLGVAGIRTMGIPADRKGALLNLLAISRVDDRTVELAFSGGAALRLEIDAMDIVAEDIGLAQPTIFHPTHKFDDAS